uniref:GRAM domain containing 1B n=1 Tax=Anolis carolinensis TaxID=28377 RepID=A0A803TKX9_ANOCA
MKVGGEVTQELVPVAKMTETLQLPALQVPEQQEVECARVWSSSSTPTLRRRRFRMRRTRNIQEQNLEAAPPSNKDFLQLPSIEITPSSDEDTPWSNCSTPSASPRRKRFLLRKWLNVREKKEYSESRWVISFTFAQGETLEEQEQWLSCRLLPLPAHVLPCFCLPLLVKLDAHLALIS